MSPGLAHEPFRFRETKDGRVQIFGRGGLAVTLKGNRAVRFLEKVATNPESAQLLMARATGQFKFGNERQGKNRRKG